MKLASSPATELPFRVSPFKPQPEKPSMVFNVLPAIVQSRIPTIPSLRRVLSGARSNASSTKRSSYPSEIESPDILPPGSSSRPASARSRSSQGSSLDSFEAEVDFQECVSTRPQSSMSTTPPGSYPVAELSTGINWKYANQGMNLVTQSYSESHAISHNEEETIVTLTRQLYVHGMTYLLRALPSDLTPEETVCLQAAIPPNLNVVHTEACTHAVISYAPQDPATLRDSPDSPSTLHRVIAILVFQSFAMIQFLVPYMKLFAGHAYRLEKEHKITQKMVNNGLMTADKVRQHSLQLSHTVCQMNDGKVGQALNDLVIWLVRGLTGGFQQGLTDGIMLMSSEKPDGRRRFEQFD